MARYLCPNDSELLMIGIDASANPATEHYICPFCHYKKDKVTVISTHKVATDTYVPPSKIAPIFQNRKS